MLVARFTRRWRWLVVLAGVALLLALPGLVKAWPVRAEAIPPAELRALALASVDQPYQGYAESRGGMGIPDIGSLADQAALLGGSSKLRVWYAGPTAWRVDELGLTGERDLYADDGSIWVWESQTQEARRSEVTTQLRLPRPTDLLPSELGRRLLADAEPDELSELGSVRVAGRAVPGVRVTPNSTTTTVDHVDVWVEPSTGLPVRVAVTARGVRPPILESGFLDLTLTAPDPARLVFEPPPAARVQGDSGGLDLVQRAERTLPLLLPETLAGLRRGTERATAVATYGSGFDAVAVLAVSGRFVGRIVRDVAPPAPRPWGGDAGIVDTPLVNDDGAHRRGPGLRHRRRRDRRRARPGRGRHPRRRG